MRVYPRSFWTSINPKPSTVGDHFIGLPYFQSKPEVEFYPVGKPVLYVHRNPATELNLLLKEATNRTGLSDIDFNYAIAQNVEGVYVLRGSKTKCSKSEVIKVLMLIGRDERPTDLLKKNQKEFAIPSNPIPSPTLSVGDSNVHVFDLIELLIEKGLYNSRNDGVYGPLVSHAMRELQLSLDLPNLTGSYDEWVHNKLVEADREYIKLD